MEKKIIHGPSDWTKQYCISKWGYINILSQTHRLTTNKHYQSPQGMITRHTQGYGRGLSPFRKFSNTVMDTGVLRKNV